MMDASLKKMSEYFGPGCRVLDVRFARMESEDGGSLPYADRPTGSSCARASISARRELTTTASPVFSRWNHPVPGCVVRPQFSRYSRRRKKFVTAQRKTYLRIGRTPLLMAVAGVAMSISLALVFPNVGPRLTAAFQPESICLSAFSNNSSNDLLKVDESISRDYRRSLVDWQKNYSAVNVTTPCYAAVNLPYSQ